MVDPIVSGTLYAGGLGHGVNKSVDGGATWAQMNTGITDLNIYDVAMDPQDHLRLYALKLPQSSNPAEIFTTTDGAASWTPTGPLTGHAQCLAVDPVTSAVYAGGGLGVVAAPAGGAAWTPLGTGLLLAITEKRGNLDVTSRFEIPV